MQRYVDDGGFSEAWASNPMGMSVNYEGYTDQEKAEAEKYKNEKLVTRIVKKATNEVLSNIGSDPKAEVNYSPSSLPSIYHSNNLFGRKEIDYFHKRYRYGILNPYEALTTAREYVFFTKPDLQIMQQDELTGFVSSGAKMVKSLEDDLYWFELYSKFPEVIECLQSSFVSEAQKNQVGVGDPFNHLLENTLQTNIDVPGISSEMVETPVNTYGVGYKYHGSSEASDDNFSFSLEFKDTRYLPVYHFFRAYEDYQIKKHHGTVAPWIGYIENRILHDQYSIYKFLVDEDGETIIYYAKYYGVTSKSLPRDVFSNTSFENGLSYSIDFECAFFEDMKPQILQDFNKLALPLLGNCPYWIEPYNGVLDQADTRPGRVACVVRETDGGKNAILPVTNTIKIPYNMIKNDMLPFDHKNDPGQYVYKLKWKGDDIY